MVPKLATRSAKLWLLGILVVVLGVVGHLAVTQPQNRWAAAVTLPLIALFVLFAVSQRTCLDTEVRAAIRQNLWLFSKRVPLEGATAALVTDRGGSLLLDVRAGGRRPRVYVTVLALTDHIERSLPAPMHVLLAEQLTAHRVTGGAAVAKQLRTQAELIEAGGTRNCHRWLRISAASGSTPPRRVGPQAARTSSTDCGWRALTQMSEQSVMLYAAHKWFVSARWLVLGAGSLGRVTRGWRWWPAPSGCGLVPGEGSSACASSRFRRFG